MARNDTERRASFRAPLSIHVRVQHEGQELGEFLARDVSPEGVFVISEAPLAVGSEVRLGFGADGPSLGRLQGRVVRSQVVHGLASHGLSGMAIHFEGMSEPDHARLQALVEDIRRVLRSSGGNA